MVDGEPGADPDLSILIPTGAVPWGGHSRTVCRRAGDDLIERHKTTLVFCNTRSLAELIFQELWAANDKTPADRNPPRQPGAGGAAQGRGGDGRRAGCAHWSRTASLDLGIDWGDVDLVIQMGAPKGSSRLLQRIGRANHRLDEPSQGMIVPGNRFEYLEARAALDAVAARELDPEIFRPGTLDVLAQHIIGVACAGPFDEAELLAEVRSAAPYAGLTDEVWRSVLDYISTGGYQLRAYDKFKRLVEDMSPASGGSPRPPSPPSIASTPGSSSTIR